MEKIKIMFRHSSSTIVPDIAGFSSMSNQCTKSVFLERPQYHTRYRIRYRCPYIISCKAAASFPRLPSIDSNEDHEMDYDDQRDFMDQNIPAEQFPTADPGPIHHFLCGIPNW